MNRQYILSAVIPLLAVSIFTGPAAAQSPLSDGSAAHLWLIDEKGETVGSFNVAPGAWTLEATTDGTELSVTHDQGSSILAVDPSAFGAVLVNRTAGSLPPVDPGTPLSLAGTGPAVSDPGEPQLPGVVITPASGDYDRTIRVDIAAIPAPVGTGTESLELFYRIDGGLERKAAGREHAVFLVGEGEHQVETWTTTRLGVFKFTSPVQARTFNIVGAGPITRDTDGDGVPDLYEAVHGMDPLADDLAQDRDRDGWTDFAELIRGSDANDLHSVPQDSDGDGWSDFDEQVRGTNPEDPALLTDPDSFFPSRPVARRLNEVEYVLSGNAWLDAARTLAQAPVGNLTVLTTDWRTLYRQRDVPTLDALAEAGIEEETMPPYLQPGVVDQALAAGELPPLRVPAGDPMIIQLGGRDEDGQLTGWTAKSWLAGTPDLHPAAVIDFLDTQDGTFEDAAQWEAAYNGYLQANAVQPLVVAIDPETSAAVALVESAVAWFGQGAPTGQGAQSVLLGDLASASKPQDAVSGLALRLGDTGRDLEDLYAELSDLMATGGPLADFADTVETLFTNFDPGAAAVGDTTTRRASALVQGDSADDHPLAVYLARLHVVAGGAQLESLPAQQRDQWQDPAADIDGDGLTNSEELTKPPPFASRIDVADSDGDGVADAADPCPSEDDDACLEEAALNADSDQDGVIDPLDGFPEDPTAS